VAALDATRKFGSLEEQIFLLAEQFRAHSACLRALLLPGRDCSEVIWKLRQSALEVETLDLRPFRVATLARLLAIVRQHAIEVIHWNFYHPINNPYLWALKVLTPGIRHFYTDHISRQAVDLVQRRGIHRASRRLLLKVYERMFAVSDYVCANTVWALGPLPNLGRCTHFVNTARFAPDPESRRQVRAEQAATDQFILLIVAALIPDKGVDVALRAVAQLPETVVLWLVGSGRECESLSQLAARLGLADRVRFLGLQQDVSPFMKAADVLVCPSLWGEAAGLVNIEAMACGLPVVASQVGGIPEIVADGVTGYLFPPGNHDTLAELIRSLHENPQRRAAMGARARSTALERYSPERLLPDYLAWYQLDAPRASI
jgi:glycosyltransferase involved in cell wall biosynthesis